MFNDWSTNRKTYTALKTDIENIFLSATEHSQNDFLIPFFNGFDGNKAEILDGNPIFSAKMKNKPFLIKIVIDDDIDGATYFHGSFDNMSLFTIIVPVNQRDCLESLITFWLKQSAA